MSGHELPEPALFRAYPYAPALPDTGHVMAELGVVRTSLADLHRKLDTLIAALAEEDQDLPELTLDGAPAGGERNQADSLG